VAPVAPGVFGVVSYDAVINGGTGKFAGTGTCTLRRSRPECWDAVLRYSGKSVLAMNC